MPIPKYELSASGDWLGNIGPTRWGIGDVWYALSPTDDDYHVYWCDDHDDTIVGKAVSLRAAIRLAYRHYRLASRLPSSLVRDLPMIG